MAVRTIRQMSGLVTDVSPLDAAEGAMRQADNVLLHRPGIIQPRIGIGDTTGITARSAADYRPIAMWPFGGGVVVQSWDSGGNAYRLERVNSATAYTGTAAPPDTTIRGSSSAVEMRGSLYYTDTDGLRKLVALADAATDVAGVVTDYVTPGVTYMGASADRYVLAATSVSAYRYCWVREDANGYVRRSAPSPRFSISNSTANYYNVRLDRIYLPSGIIAGDTFELYRTTNTTPETGDPGDEMFLAVTYEVTSTDVSAGYIEGWTIRDKVQDDQLGASLYTNASTGGILSANERPPRGIHAARWASCLWLGHTRERHSMVIEPMMISDVQTGYAETWRDGITCVLTTANFTSGSPAISAIASPAGLKVGQYITGDSASPTLSTDTHTPALTKITALATVITINNNTNIDTATPDSFLFRGVPGALTEWQSVEWTAGVASFGAAVKGASATDSATNLAAGLNTTFAGTVGVNYTATPSSNTVTITDDDGHGVYLEIVESTGGTYSVAYSATMDANAKADGTTVSMRGHDYITIDSIEFYASTQTPIISITQGLAGTTTINERLFNVIYTRSGGATENLSIAKDVSRSLGDVINAYAIAGTGTALDVRAVLDDMDSGIEPAYTYSSPNSLGPTQILLLREDPGDGTFTFNAPVRPRSFRPSLADAKTTPSSTTPGRVWYSKPDEPEAFPPVNFFDVGDPKQAILALTALDDVLLVWKTDGLFRIVGTPPSGWALDEIRAGETPIRLLAPEAVTVLDDAAYAWTDQGVIRTGGDGYEVISGQIGRTLRELQRAYYRDETGKKHGTWMTAHRRLGLIILSVAASTSQRYCDAQYVWHRSTGLWSKWTRTDRCSAYDTASDRLIVSPYDAGTDTWRVLYERSDEDAAASYVDQSQTSALANGFTVDGSTITITAADIGWTPTVCDVVYMSWEGIGTTSGYFQPTLVTPSGSDIILTFASAVAPTLATLYLYQGWGSTMLWQAQHASGLGFRWSELHAELGNVVSAYLTNIPVDMGGASHRDSSPSSVEATITPTVTYSSPLRCGLPRAVVRTPQFYPYVKFCGAGVLWELAHLNLHATPVSRRVAR